ncbi:MAG: pantetheine-phosphate adenylyltransferase [Crocinitomicaceae bacterium]|nr:pantetheine-phosphate adenylyltransferase [Crocinitomicaceae bacterium]
MSKVVVFPGSFDPFTKGHEEIVNRGLEIFDKVIIAIGENSQKNYLFSLESRIQHIASIFEGMENVEIKSFTGLTVDFVSAQNTNLILRGLRNSSDFNFERTIAQMNHEIKDVESVFLMTTPELSAINSSVIRDIKKNGGDISKFVTNDHFLAYN